MEVRLAVALGLVLCCALCGKALADGARRRAAMLKAMANGARRLRIHMTGMFEPVQVALAHAECPLFALIAREMQGGGSARQAWERVQGAASRRGGPIDCLTDEDKHALSTLFAGLGQSGRETQDLLLGSVIEAIENLHAGAQARAREADRLYATLGLLIGLMLALIVV